MNKDINNSIIEKEYYTLQPQINDVITKFNEEEHSFSKLHRLIDLIEVIIKTHSAYAISNYVEVREFLPEIQKNLAFQLAKPSLGN